MQYVASDHTANKKPVCVTGFQDKSGPAGSAGVTDIKATSTQPRRQAAFFGNATRWLVMRSARSMDLACVDEV
jgi:hypothetical protein